jgi:transposase-like protein
MRNLRSKVPENVSPKFHACMRVHYEAASLALARLLRENIATTYGSDLPATMAWHHDDFGACIGHLWFPLVLRRVIRTTNLLERLFGEERRRTKTIPHVFGKRAV